MSITKVSHLQIEKFRRFKDITIQFGNNVTLIAGQNGTSKSTLLGMLAQPFSFGVVRGKTANTPDASSYTDNYHDLKLDEYVDFTGKSFMYDCDDVFRLSKQFDSGNEYTYNIGLDGANILSDSRLNENPLTTISRTTSGRMRFVTGPGPSHKPGEGNFPHPVIYLGLNRLWPLAVTRNCTFTDDALSNNDRKWYIEKYNEILCLDEHDNNAKYMDTFEKRRFITAENDSYDGESCSAGQDNLSQFLTAILSFRSLKKKLGNQYRGGMLLIDELDATLHAFAQDKLLEQLCEVSEELGLQVVATTHSLRLLEKAYQSPLKKDIEVIYLSNKDGAIIKENVPTYQEISDLLKVEASLPSIRKPKKVSVVFEDKEGEFLFKQICGSKLRNYISCNTTDTLGGGHLKNLATMSKSLPELETVILLPDGDMGNTWSNPPKNLLPLPGSKRPETLIYRHLFSIKDSDPFWKKVGTSYTKQVAIIRKGGRFRTTGDNKEWVKIWYKKESCYWGQSNQKVFKSWIEANKKECLAFCNEFLKLLKGRYKGDIPKDVIQRTRAQFK